MSAVGPGRQQLPETKEIIHHYWNAEMQHGESDSDEEESRKPKKTGSTTKNMSAPSTVEDSTHDGR